MGFDSVFVRRRFLGAVGGASLAITSPFPSLASPTPWPQIGVHRLWIATTNGEELAVKFWDGQRFDAHRLVELSWLLRDWRDDNAAVSINRTLFRDLAQIQTGLSLRTGRPRLILVNSGYRTPRRNATLEGASPHSQHIVGRACDFNLEGVRPSLVADYAAAYGVNGLGRYADFTHIDVGPAGRRW